MSMTTKYRAKNKLQVCFTEQQISFLRQQKEETGDTMNSIIRRAVLDYQIKIVDEKIKNTKKSKG